MHAWTALDWSLLGPSLHVHAPLTQDELFVHVCDELPESPVELDEAT